MLHVLGIESSCDETAAAVVREDGLVLSSVVASQADIHAQYGGVMPEVAARHHVQSVARVVAEAIEESGLSLPLTCGGDGRALRMGEPHPRGLHSPGGHAVTSQSEDGHAWIVAATMGPGLAGGLLVGSQFAKAYAWGRGLPFVGVDHLHAHMLSPFLVAPESANRVSLKTAGLLDDPHAFPFVILLVSGGHTALYRMDDACTYVLLGQTRDDAAGEAFDKGAAMLGLAYPGGPAIDALAEHGDPGRWRFPRPMLRDGMRLDFSFSGLKTSLARHLQKNGVPSSEQALHDVCASYRQAIVDVLVQRAQQACRREKVSRLVIAGGVAASRALRRDATAMCEADGRTLSLPAQRFCTDNAAMVALAGSIKHQRDGCDGWDLATYCRPLGRARGCFDRDGVLRTPRGM